eukprot:CAMPEP_0201917626 /NCGR_PEP_ID=MMETSP0903-20130614/6970_1 /ASSEMBLY_ACC=CAM_ASM_000552 /TAXON_ID=420261 /ORGANISM="Thalassiosira antarctica, Strain CCMP982" /LENGTH=98 /DNA_ID=CAMNT_0048453719 /DNA_START=77 /DNA_END=370 /DNA_ORIENTATION=+
MTLPLYMKNRAASSFEGSLQDLEANAVFSLAHKFEHDVCGSILADVGLVDADMAQLPDQCPLVDGTVFDKTNKRPLTPNQAADVVDAALEDYQMVTPP